MKKSFQMVDLDCANCAQKMEDAIRQLDGVEDVNVSFLMQKLTISAQEDQFDRIMKQVVKTCRKIEPDCEIQL
jgi:copper chaperone CopZ